MEPPKSAEVFETDNNKYWFDNDILFVIIKNAPQPSFEEHKKQTEEFKQKLNGKKICAIIDFSSASSSSSKESREYSAIETPKMFTAIGMVSNSSLTRMIANIYFGLNRPPLPIKFFSNEAEAMKWLKQYL